MVLVKLHSVYSGLGNKWPNYALKLHDRVVLFDHIFCRSFLHESWHSNIICHFRSVLEKCVRNFVSDNTKSSIERLRKKKNSGIKVRKKDGQKGDSSVPGSDVTRRQRMDLKGPRVKHVCRSASIVLGQLQATFPLDKRVEKIQVKPIQGKVIHT